MGGERTEEHHQKVYVNYSKIEGLKNKSVEEKINNNIAAKIESLYPQELLDDKNITKITITANISANYSDVISVEIIQTIFYLDESEEYRRYGLNYELESGSEIQFRNMFTYNAQVTPIIEQSAYETFAWNYIENAQESQYDELASDLSQVDYSDIENKVYNSVVAYKKAEKVEFWFTEKDIFVILNNEQIKIDMSKHCQDIAIYTRYLSSTDLYDYDDYGVRNLFVFSSRVPQYYTDIEDKKNCYIDITIYTEAGISDEILTNLKNKVKLKIAEVRQFVNENSGRAVLYAGIVYVSNNNGIVECSFDIGRYEMSEEYYNSTFYDKIGEQARREKVDISYSIDYDEQNVVYEIDSNIITYNAETNEQIGTDNMESTIQSLVDQNNTIDQNNESEQNNTISQDNTIVQDNIVTQTPTPTQTPEPSVTITTQ